MGPDLGLVEIVHFVSMAFPSIAQYIKVIAPIVVFGLSVIGIFSNILPAPGEPYPLPEVEDLASELKPQGRVVYALARLSRSITLRVNRIICGRPYKVFYNTTKLCSKLVNRMRGVETKSSKLVFTKLRYYTIDIKRPRPPKTDDETRP